MFHGTSRTIGCSSAILLMLTTSALSEDNERVQRAQRMVGKVKGAANTVSLWSDGKDLMNYQAARLDGTPSPKQTDKAIKALDSIGSQASGAAAVALGGQVAGAVSTAQGAALMPVVKSVGRAANKRGSHVAELLEATKTGAVDLAKVEAIGRAYDADTAELGKWEVDYGSSWEALGRMAKSMSVNVGSGSMAFLGNAIQSIQGFLDSQEAGTPGEQTTPTIGRDNWKTVSFIDGQGTPIGTNNLNVCEPFPGLNGSDWGEVYVQRYFADNESGKRCQVTSRSDSDPAHKRYTATCEMQIQACTAIYCSPTGAVPANQPPQVYTTHESLELTKASPDKIVQLYKMDSENFQIHMVIERCSK
ncbi:hypothetical protein [Neorhizobium alkalisoli]|uniref:hypothetical protein n=1 Tax=Neorhizobium alkalisoli TaxID=528178 RepID=UPI00131A09CF|nr:hypothetical protein [Neorhizobium alkalisoli]